MDNKEIAEKKKGFNWTTSKVLSFLIFTAGVGLSFYFKDKEPFLVAIMYATLNQGVKNLSPLIKDLKNSIKK